MDCSSLSCDGLLRACADPENTGAWREFVRRFNLLIKVTVSRVARRYRASRGPIIDDLVQETYVKICANGFHLLRTFKSKHDNACYGAVKIIARNVAIDYFRKLTPLPSDCTLMEDNLPEAETPGSRFHTTPVHELDRQIVRQRIERIDKILKEHCSQRDQEIFRLYHLQEFSAREIAELPKFKELSTKGVESILHRLKCLIRENYYEEEEAQHGPR